MSFCTKVKQTIIFMFVTNNTPKKLRNKEVGDNNPAENPKGLSKDKLLESTYTFERIAKYLLPEGLSQNEETRLTQKFVSLFITEIENHPHEFLLNSQLKAIQDKVALQVNSYQN